MRMTRIAVIAMCLFAGAALAAQSEEPSVKIDIASQPIGPALNEFARQSGLQVFLASREGSGIVTPRVSGTFTPSEALTHLLVNTGLRFEFLNDRTVAVREVRGRKGEPIADADPALAMHVAEGGSQGSQRSAAAEGNASQDSEVKLEEVVVTAQKRQESIKDVPMTITAISGADLQRRHMTDLESLSFAVPGLNVVNQGGGRLDISIRGVQSFRGRSSLTGVYVDDAPVSGPQDGFTPGYLNINTLDLQRVEVLKGPQGTLFGEGSVGGVIRYVTNNPNLSQFGGQASTDLSSTESGGANEQVTGVLNVPIATDVFGVRLAAMYQNNSGWIDNIGTGNNNFNNDHLVDVRLKSLWKAASSVSISTTVEVHRNRGGGGNIANISPIEDSLFVQGFDRTMPTHFLDDFQVYNLSANVELGFANFLSSSSFTHYDSSIDHTQISPAPTIDDPFQTTNIIFQQTLPDYTLLGRIFSQELRLTSVGAGPFKWTAGANYKRARLDREFVSGVFANLFNGAFLFSGFNAGQIDTSLSEGWAGFADASYMLIDKLELGAGARYYSHTTQAFDNTALSQYLVETFKKPTYRAYVRYAATDHVNLYGTIGTGFRSGDFNNTNGIAHGAPLGFDPETSITYEVGEKSTFLNGRAGLDFAVYRQKYQNQFQDVQGAGFSYTVNAGDARINGAEVDLTLRPLDSLKLALSGGWIDTRFTKALPGAPVLLGDPLSFVPKWDVQLSANYSFKWSASMPGNIDIAYSRRGKEYFIGRGGLSDISIDTTNPIDLLQARIAAQWNSFEFSLFGRNLLDERGALNPTTESNFAQARPRTLGISVSKSF